MDKLAPVLYIASVSPLSERELYREACGAVSEERRKKAEHYRFLADRCLSLGAELLLQAALREVGYDGFPSPVVYGENGKPRFSGNELCFNLSHSGGYAACALSGSPVGCDAEKITDADLRIAKRFFAREEYEDIMAGETPAARSERFFRYWTLKESYAKVSGAGLALSLPSLVIRWEGERAVAPPVDGRAYAFTEFFCVKDYHFALCAEAAEAVPQVLIRDMRKILRER